VKVPIGDVVGYSHSLLLSALPSHHT